MQFTGDMAVIQQRLAQCSDMVARRTAVLDALQTMPGWRALEVGCGGGYYNQSFASVRKASAKTSFPSFSHFPKGTDLSVYSQAHLNKWRVS